MRGLRLLSAILLLGGLTACDADAPEDAAQPPDFLFTDGIIYTVEGEPAFPGTVAVTGNRITAVVREGEGGGPQPGPETRVVNLEGRLLLPGFVDGHTHFAGAGRQLSDANLLRVSDDAALAAEISRVVANLAPGEWVTRGYWGAYEQWARGSAGEEAGDAGGNVERWRPSRDAIDAVSPDNPVFVQSFDSALYLANRAALEAAALFEEPVDGMALDAKGRPTGLIEAGSPAIQRLEAAVTPKSDARLMAESRRALASLAASGVTEIHDITGDEQMERFVRLREAGELTARVWMRADLSRAAEFNQRGIRMGTHPVTHEPDPYLRWGAYKGYIDGIMGNHTALFFEPYDDQPENYGRYRPHTSDDPEFLTPNMEKIYGYLVEARRGGFPANVHAIGTRGVSLMLDTYERLMEEAGEPLDGYRVIHAQVIRPEDFPRFQALGVFAEVNPYHLSDDMRWMEERIGYERARGAYAFRSLLENGAELIFASDWPGTLAAEYFAHPKYLLHAAVNRTTIDGTPEGGWFPEQKISLAEALRAYTLNGARGAFDGETRGSIRVGKLADLTVVDRNLFDIDASEILEMEIDLTMVDGKVVYERQESGE